jgi:hypothetical protein
MFANNEMEKSHCTKEMSRYLELRWDKAELELDINNVGLQLEFTIERMHSTIPRTVPRKCSD